VVSKESINPNKKDARNFELLCDMAELTALFEKKSSLSEFLYDVVSMVGAHMKSDVCSVYLYNQEKNELIMRASHGLTIPENQIITLKPGEGITGKSFEESRSIREGRASQNPYFKPIPGVEEHMYQAFLAVPIRRGVTKIGVLTLQDKRKNAFSSHDTRALKAIASQLAASLENAEVLMEMYQSPNKDSSQTTILSGVSTSSKIAIGSSVLFRSKTASFTPIPVPVEQHLPCNETEELVAFARSLTATKEQLESLQLMVDNKVAEMADLIFGAHLLMLRDEKFSGAMQEKIQTGSSAARAVTEVVNSYVHTFSQHQNQRIREKAQDILDLGLRLLKNLTNPDNPILDYTDQIIIAADLFPSELVRISAQNAAGLVTLGSGHTAHIALLARSLKLPTIFVHSEQIVSIPDGTLLLIDGSHEELHIDPHGKIISEFQQIIAQNTELTEIPCPKVSVTEDGVPIKVLANVNLIQDVETALNCNAEGIGLYRSEFPFLVRNDFPSEEEQTRLYRRVLEPMESGEVVIRTLDIGGDKLMGVQQQYQESNPFLGFRGIRFSLSNLEIFTDQLRAIIRAGKDRDLRIMFPMISSLDEFLLAKDQVLSILEELKQEGLDHNPKPLLGAMIELPAAVEITKDLNKHADFLSVGTNDLIMYTLAVDRTNEKIGSMYTAHHPAVLRSLDRIIRSLGNSVHKLSVCGEAVHDLALLTFLLGRGVRKVSVDPNRIPKLKSSIIGLNLRRAQKISRELLKIHTLKDMDSYITKQGLNLNG
jgi:phosphotransferase system enzyme I (PtsP)